MSARLEIGHEKYTVENQTVIPVDPDDKAMALRARFLTSVGPAWLEDASLGYDPDPDCSMAKVISDHVKGRYTCEPNRASPGVTY